MPRRVAAGIQRFGAIDVLVNSAGFGQYGIFEGITRQAETLADLTQAWQAN